MFILRCLKIDLSLAVGELFCILLAFYEMVKVFIRKCSL